MGNTGRTPEQRAQIERLWAEGKTVREIGAEIGWALSTAKVKISQLRAQGYDLPHRRTPEQVARIAGGWRRVRERSAADG